MDYFTYNSNSKVKQHYANKQFNSTRKQQQQVKSAYAANVLLAKTARKQYS